MEPFPMTPYLLNTTWVDLDHVLAVQDRVEQYHASFMVGGRITMAFRDEPLWISVGQVMHALGQPEWSSAPYSPDPRDVARVEAAQAIWSQFIEAWKARPPARLAPIQGFAHPDGSWRTYPPDL